MLSRSLRRAALDPQWRLPPTYLLPWTANLTTATQTTASETLPASSLPTSEPSKAPAVSQPASNSTSLLPSSLKSKIKTTAYSTPSTSSVKHATSPRPSTPARPPAPKSPISLSPSTSSLLPLLRAQKQIYIKTHIHARPYLVTQGDTVRLPFLMPGVQPGDILRLNRATVIGSRDYTLRAPASDKRGKSNTAGTAQLSHIEPAVGTSDTARQLIRNKSDDAEGAMEHFVPHLAKGRTNYLDDRLFVCRAVVLGTESEPLRVMEKTKRRQRHTRHVKSKHRYTVLRIKEVRVRSVEELEGKEQVV
ncbi:putative 54S ribosomal protein L49 [Elsinoe fawcettii]|nr:putative 54S ribosomal protein L49 [Elsinoe fawcettii]